MSKKKSLKYQVQGMLSEKLAIGKSRHEAKDEEGRSPYIHSWSTYNSYVKHCLAFALWAKKLYNVVDVKEMEILVDTYLQLRTYIGLSAWTVSLDAAALAKLYGCRITDFGTELPKRRRGDIKRSRRRNTGFDEEAHREAVDFCRGTGLRRHEMAALTGADISKDNGTVYVHVEKGKGGKRRNAPVRTGFEGIVLAAAERCRTEEEKLFPKGSLPSRMPAHGYRAEYAKAQYSALERPLGEIPKKERYICRKDKAGIVYDKQAMAEVSKMLGHNRLCVIAESYLY